MRELLNNHGLQRRPGAQFAAWEAQNRVPPTRCPACWVSCWIGLESHGENACTIPAQKSDGMQVSPVRVRHSMPAVTIWQRKSS